MAGYPSFNLPSTSFTPGGAPSWFPGGPQFGATLSRMMQDYNAFAPQLSNVEGLVQEYGGMEQADILDAARRQTAGLASQAAGAYTPGVVASSTAARGFGGSGIGSTGSLGSVSALQNAMMSNAGVMAGARSQAGQIPQQTANIIDQLQRQYKQGQLGSLQQMIDLIGQAAGGQYGYQSAQLGADAEQIALANAQNREAQQNMQALMHGLGSLYSLGSGNPATAGNIGLSLGIPQELGSLGASAGASAGASMGSADFMAALAEAAPMFFA